MWEKPASSPKLNLVEFMWMAADVFVGHTRGRLASNFFLNVCGCMLQLDSMF